MNTVEEFRMQNCAEKVFNMLKTMCENGTLVSNVRHEVFNVKRLSQTKLSVFNQLLLMAQGATDARTYNEWKKVKRFVKSGEKAVFIFKPLIIKEKDENEDDKNKCIGFTLSPRFDVSQTDGEPLESEKMIETFYEGGNKAPLYEIAKQLDIKVIAEDSGSALGGYYALSNKITLKSKDESVFAHELIHAADYVNYKKQNEDYHNNMECRQMCETVAEFGAAVLMSYLGCESHCDLNGVLSYLTSWNDKSPKQALIAVSRLIKRVEKNVTYLVNALEGQVEQEAIPA